MDKLRRSFRKSFRRGSSLKTTALNPSSNSPPPTNKKLSDKGFTGSATISSNPTLESSSKRSKEKDYCQIDEAAVRSTACCFMVKVVLFIL